MNKLSEIQAKVKAPKGQLNKFGNYKYRSAEDIVEAVKPVINPMGFYLTLSDEMVQLGERFYVKATATLTNGTESYQTTAFAREEENKKGQDGSQITGAASSYARKYALNGLFAIDDTKDSDATNTHDKDIVDVPAESERKLLRDLVYSSDLSPDEQEKAFEAIETCENYDKYQKIQFKLEARQAEPVNANQKDISKKVRSIAKPPVNAI